MNIPPSSNCDLFKGSGRMVSPWLAMPRSCLCYIRTAPRGEMPPMRRAWRCAGLKRANVPLTPGSLPRRSAAWSRLRARRAAALAPSFGILRLKKAAGAPPLLRAAAWAAWAAGWWTLMSVCQQDSLAASLLDDSFSGGCAAVGDEPPLAEVLAGGVLDGEPSRLPP